MKKSYEKPSKIIAIPRRRQSFSFGHANQGPVPHGRGLFCAGGPKGAVGPHQG
ncbi:MULTISPECIES: hypothetical protein [Mesorhizobium]|uniref:hypothetical protein n=1 Tax=Mesorhizobium TaxID=68287 RepID=UPI0013DEBBF0|nr:MULTISPECIES: hypothetical protein [Mesorhizobium]